MTNANIDGIDAGGDEYICIANFMRFSLTVPDINELICKNPNKNVDVIEIA